MVGRTASWTRSVSPSISSGTTGSRIARGNRRSPRSGAMHLGSLREAVDRLEPDSRSNRSCWPPSGFVVFQSRGELPSISRRSKGSPIMVENHGVGAGAGKLAHVAPASSAFCSSSKMKCVGSAYFSTVAFQMPRSNLFSWLAATHRFRLSTQLVEPIPEALRHVSPRSRSRRPRLAEPECPRALGLSPAWPGLPRGRRRRVLSGRSASAGFGPRLHARVVPRG